MHRITFLLHVSPRRYLLDPGRWLRSLEKPEPTGKPIILELDEMWHHVKKKRKNLWIWKALDRDTGPLLDWECGRRDKMTLKKLVDRLARWDVKVYCTDQWGTYASSYPRTNSCRAKPRPMTLNEIIADSGIGLADSNASRSSSPNPQEMVNLTMALFARFWVNGNQDELLSLLG